MHERRLLDHGNHRGLKLRKRTSPLIFVFLSFAVVILIGSGLLMLPISQTDPSTSYLGYVDSLFLATSAVCVTGLNSVSDLTVHLSIFGQAVICLLIKIGGLGLVTILAAIIIFMGKQMDYKNALVVKEALSQPGMGDLKSLVKDIIFISMGFELFGTCMNLIVFSQEFDFPQALWISFFHAISSFNNAGFDILGATSLTKYSNNVLLNLNTCFLILAGGLGFLVYEDIFKRKAWRKFSIQTRAVVITNFSLLIVSMLIVKGMEQDNITWLESFFYAVNMRTAGFATFDVGSTLRPATKLVSTIFMIIGGSPLSTAGGIKTVTLFIMISSIFSFARGKKDIVFKREIGRNLQVKAFILCFVAFFDIFLVTILISIIETPLISSGQMSILDVYFESSSAFGTVGLSTGFTSLFSSPSKILLCLLMYFGRLGPVTIINLWNSRLNKPQQDNVQYLYTDLMIG